VIVAALAIASPPGLAELLGVDAGELSSSDSGVPRASLDARDVIFATTARAARHLAHVCVRRGSDGGQGREGTTVSN
jgi:hypothetical protein